MTSTGPVLVGRLVRLRPAAGTDVEALVAVRGAPEVVRFWRGGDDPAGQVADDLAADDTVGSVIEVDGAVAGWIQWYADDDPDYRHAGIDLYVGPAHHGRGVGTDAVRTLATHLVDDHGFHRLVIDPAADNAAAIACYSKVGFRPVGVLRRYERGDDGTWHDGLLMDLLADELVR